MGRPRLPLRSKIVLPFVLLVVLVGTIGTAAVTAQVTSESVAAFDATLLRASLLANDHLALLEAARLTTLRAAADTATVPEATLARDTTSLARLLTPVLANAAVPSLRLDVLDASATDLIAIDAGGTTTPDGTQFASAGAVRDVLRGKTDALGDKYVFLAGGAAGQSLFWVGPIHTDNAQLVGAVVLSQPLAAIAAGIRASGASDIAFYTPAGDPVFASLPPLALDRNLRAMVRPDAPVRTTIARDGHSYTLLVSDWTMRGAPIGYLAVALDAASLAGLQTQLRLLLVLLFGAAAVITLLIGLTLAGLITRPLAQLVSAMQGVAAGDLGRRAPIGPHDEIGYLSQVFNQMAVGLQEKTRALEDTYFAAMEALARAIDARDPSTYGHSERVAAISLEIASAIGYPSEKREALRRAALLHDIGKIGVEDRVLRKPGPLNYAEARAMREHTVIGYQMLRGLEFLEASVTGVRHHHERWDGNGYPDGLAGDSIPLQVRILSVADVFDALTSDRPYRPAMSVEEAMALINQESGRQFDPDVVAAFRVRAAAIYASLERTPSRTGPSAAPVEGLVA